MSQNLCCVPGCLVRREDGVPLHRFPNPDSEEERYNSWIANIGGEIATLDKDTVCKNRRVCHKHFKDNYKYPKNRLNKLAIPVLHMPECSGPSLTETVIPILPSTSYHSNIQMNVVNAGQNIEQDEEYRRTQLCLTTQKDLKTRKSKGLPVSNKQHKIYKSLLKKLRKCKSDKRSLERKYRLAKSMTKTKAFKVISKKMSSTASLFCQMQVSQSGKRKKGRRFTLEEKILALSLFKPSPKAYRLLRKMCILPGRRTLQSLLNKINIKAGINDLIFENLKNRVARLPVHHKYCSILFDEMAIGPGVSYDKRNDLITGFVNDGENTEKEYSDHVLVFMIRGIVKKFKQPLAYYFCSGSTKAIHLKQLLKQIVQKLHETGLKVVSTVCDQGTSNLSAINNLLCETKANYMRIGKNYTEGFFEVGKNKIFPIFDPPHLMKGIRNNLVTKNLRYTMEGRERVAKWSHILGLFNRSIGYRGVKLVPKLTAQHVIPALIPKMRVKHCTQVFSKSVAVSLAVMAELGPVEKDSKDTADLLMFFDDLFDSVNGSYSQIQGGKVYRTAVTPTSPHHKLWNYSLPILKTMKFVNANNLGVVPSLSSWIRSIENFQRIAKHLSTKGVNSLLLRNFNQDPLENFFGAIRAHGYSNIMPTSSAFENAYKTLLINNISSPHSVGSNCEEDDNICLQSLKHLLLQPGANCTTQCGDEIDGTHLCLELVDTDKLISSKDPIYVERSAAIGYCSGWIAQVAKNNVYKKCSTCLNDLEAEQMESFHEFIKKKEYENKNWLCYPTRALFNFFAQVENICILILEENCTRKNISNYIKLVISINLNTSFLNCAVHKNNLAQYLINKCTLFFINNWCKDINNLLTGKTNHYDINDIMKHKAFRHFSKNKGRKRKRQTDVIVNV